MITSRFHVPRMDCATEKEVIGRRLDGVGGVEQVEYDLLDRVLIVRHAEEATAAKIEDALRDIAMDPVRIDGDNRPTGPAGGDHEGPDHDHAGHDHKPARPARRIAVLAVDKTGTLTEGRPRLTDVEPVSAMSRDDVLARAASLEASAAHPLLAAADAVSTDGKGIEGTVGGERIGIGLFRLAVESTRKGDPPSRSAHPDRP